VKKFCLDRDFNGVREVLADRRSRRKYFEENTFEVDTPPES